MASGQVRLLRKEVGFEASELRAVSPVQMMQQRRRVKWAVIIAIDRGRGVMMCLFYISYEALILLQ